MVENRSEHSTAPSNFVDASRDALVSALLAAGPNQPTLCDGWQTQHLAAHIYLRESTPAPPGRLSKALAKRLESRTLQLGDDSSSPKNYQKLVSRIARGPERPDKPRRRSLLDRLKRSSVAQRFTSMNNLMEFFVHTEDIRRAQPRWAPRRLSNEYADALFEQLRIQAKHYYKDAKTGYVLVRSNGERIEAKKGQAHTYVTGPAGELVMHALGRHDHALVLIDKA